MKINEKGCGVKTAVKVFNKNGLSLINKEIEILSSLDHKNIVKMVNNDENSIEFEFMDIELYDLVEAEKFSENHCVCIAKEILEGLLYLE